MECLYFVVMMMGDVGDGDGDVNLFEYFKLYVVCVVECVVCLYDKLLMFKIVYVLSELLYELMKFIVCDVRVYVNYVDCDVVGVKDCDLCVWRFC